MKSIMKALQNPNAKIAMKLKRLNKFTEHPEPGKGKGVGMRATKMGCYFFVCSHKTWRERRWSRRFLRERAKRGNQIV